MLQGVSDYDHIVAPLTEDDNRDVRGDGPLASRIKRRRRTRSEPDLSTGTPLGH